MADVDYTHNLVYYPWEVSRVRLPTVLPAGALSSETAVLSFPVFNTW